ncbi:MAG: DUF4253 domain-containing protein [Hyphomicrobium sp.]
MTTLDVNPGERGFVRRGGRETLLLPPELTGAPDDIVVSPFDFVMVPGADAENALVQLKRERPQFTPLLFGSPHEAGILFERMPRRKETPADWLRQADQLDTTAWLEKRKAQHDERCAKHDAQWPRRGPWPDQVRKFNQLSVPNQTLKPECKKPQVVIGLLPTADPTEIAAYLSFGGWNDCPPPPVHLAFARLWHEKYGAVQQSNTHDVVEFSVAHPVQNRDEALKLALDQFFYCTGSVPETLEVAAAELIGATVWQFWWD